MTKCPRCKTQEVDHGFCDSCVTALHAWAEDRKLVVAAKLQEKLEAEQAAERKSAYALTAHDYDAIMKHEEHELP